MHKKKIQGSGSLKLPVEKKILFGLQYLSNFIETQNESEDFSGHAFSINLFNFFLGLSFLSFPKVENLVHLQKGDTSM